MDYSPNEISRLLDVSNRDFIGFGYGAIKYSAEYTAKIYGCDWAMRFPTTREAVILKQQIRDLVMSHIPKNHSNKDVVWQRYRQYAIKFCSQRPLATA